MYAIIGLGVLIVLIVALVLILFYLRKKNRRILAAMKELQQSEETKGGLNPDTEGKDGIEISKRAMLPSGYGTEIGYESRDGTSKMRSFKNKVAMDPDS